MKLTLYFGEPYQRKEAREQLINRWEEELSCSETQLYESSQLNVEKLGQLLNSKSLFQDSKIIRVTHGEEIQNPERWASCIVSAPLDQIGILLEGQSFKKSSPLYKLFDEKGTVKKFQSPSKRNYSTFIKRIEDKHEASLTKEARNWLAQVLEVDLLRVEREIQKIALYNEGGKISASTVKKIVWARGQGKLFTFLDYLSQRQLSESLTHLSQLLTQDVEPSKIFFMIAREVRMLLSIKTLAGQRMTNKEIARTTGNYQWLVSKKKSAAKKFELEELTKLLHFLARKDKKIKRGRADIVDTLWEVVLEFTRRH